MYIIRKLQLKKLFNTRDLGGMPAADGKVIKHDNGITLQPLNPAYEPMFFSNKEIEDKPITILGVVREIRRGL